MTQATGAVQATGYRTDERATVAREAFYGPVRRPAMDACIRWALSYSVDGGATYMPASSISLADAMRVVDALPEARFRALLAEDERRATRS